MTTHEVVPGIYRIESILGPRPFAHYLLRETRSLPIDTGIASTPVEVDIADREFGEAMIERVVAELGGVDILVNNVAVYHRKPSWPLTDW